MSEFTCRGQLLEGGRSLVVVTGELDLHTSRELEAEIAAMRRKGASRFTLDLSTVTFMDSTALGVLIATHRDSGPLTVVATAPEVLSLFQLTGVDAVFSICRTREECF